MVCSVQAATHEIIFRVGGSASIVWFDENNPSLRGTLNVTNAPYANGASVNGAAVDLGRNRLIFDSSDVGYAISLAGLQLVPNAATPVTVTSLGTWDSAGDNAGYRKTDGQVYYHPNGSTELRTLNFGPTGLITGFTVVGNFSGPTAITQGDIDFDANGSIWMSGVNQNGDSRLWHYDPTTLNPLSTFSMSHVYSGLGFNAAGTTLYGYLRATGQYGIVDTTTGGFTSILDTDQAFFGVGGDLTTGLAMTVVPEPASLSLCVLGIACLSAGNLYRCAVSTRPLTR